MSDSPTVSVVMPAHNRGKYVGDAIDSVLRQTLSDFELIIVDDSTDNTPEVVAQYAKTDSRIKHKRIAECRLPSAFNIGIRHSQGKLLTFHADDDLSSETRLENHVDYLTTHPQAACVMPRIGQMKENGERIGEQAPGLPHRIEPMQPLSNFRQLFGPFAMFRTDCMKNIGGFRDFFYCSEDTDMALRWLERYPVDIHEDTLYYRRNHGTNLSHVPLVGLYTLAAFVSAQCRRDGIPCPIEEGLPLWDIVGKSSSCAEAFPCGYRRKDILRLIIKASKAELLKFCDNSEKRRATLRHRSRLMKSMGYSATEILKAMTKLNFYSARYGLMGK